MFKTCVAAIAVSLAAACAIVSADTITLEDGRTINGKVTSPAGAPTLKIKTDAGELSFPANQVTNIKLGEPDAAAKEAEIAALKSKIESLQTQLIIARRDLAAARKEIEQLRKSLGDKTGTPPPSDVTTRTIGPATQSDHVRGDIDVLAEMCGKFAEDVNKACDGDYTLVQKDNMIDEACNWLKSEVARHQTMTLNCQVLQVSKSGPGADTWAIAISEPAASDGSHPVTGARDRHVATRWHLNVKVQASTDDIQKINLKVPIAFTGTPTYIPTKSPLKPEDSPLSIVVTTERGDVILALRGVKCDVAHLKALAVMERTLPANEMPK